jgi:hypothetical protein
VLGDPTDFGRLNIRLTDRVKKRGLPWSTCPMMVTTGARGSRWSISALSSERSIASSSESSRHLPEFLRYRIGKIKTNHCINRDHCPQTHELHEDIFGFELQCFSKILDCKSL